MWPIPQFAWNRVSDICTRTIAPVYKVLSSTLQDDVEQLAQLFVDLEVSSALERETTYFEVRGLCLDVTPCSYLGGHKSL